MRGEIYNLFKKSNNIRWRLKKNYMLEFLQLWSWNMLQSTIIN